MVTLYSIHVPKPNLFSHFAPLCEHFDTAPGSAGILAGACLKRRNPRQNPTCRNAPAGMPALPGAVSKCSPPLLSSFIMGKLCTMSVGLAHLLLPKPPHLLSSNTSPLPTL